MPQETETIYDIGIIGGGPAGYTSAFHARKQGLSVVLFEKDKIGGVCLNKGCIPTKAILHSAELYEEMKCAQDLGISAENLSFDYEKIVEHKDKIVEKLRKNLELALKNAGVKVVYGEAEISGKLKVENGKLKQKSIITNEVAQSEQIAQQVRDYTQSQPDNDLFAYSPIRLFANNNIFLCKKLIIATGSEPKDFPTLKFDHEFVLSSDDILNLKNLPKNILIIGSGAIGIEWARIFSAFDVEVSIVEMAEHLLPLADIEVSKRIERIFKSKKIKMYLSNTVEKIEKEKFPPHPNPLPLGEGAIPSKKGKVYLKSGEILEPEYVLLAVGRKAVENSGKLKIESGKLSNFQLSTFNFQLIGDACGKIQLAHFAIKQAIKEVSGVDFDETLVPSVVYGNPEIAWVGKREQDLEKGTYQKSNLLISALGKSHCDNSTDGFIKILSQNGKILGAHIVSKEASSLIQQITIAMQNNLTVEDLKKVCFAHPTYSEGIFESLFREVG